MGQQQLLLLVLGIVIVGLAVAAGLSAFGENQEKSNRQALVNEAIRVASDLQSWRLKAEEFGGGGGSYIGGSNAASASDVMTAVFGNEQLDGNTYESVQGDITFDLSTDPPELLLTDKEGNDQGSVTVPLSSAPQWNTPEE